MLTSLWEHVWGLVWSKEHEGGTDLHAAGVAYVDVPMGACVGTRSGQGARRWHAIFMSQVWLMLTSLWEHAGERERDSQPSRGGGEE